MVSPKPLDDKLFVGPSLTAEDVATLAAQGFKSIICNRPDGEAGVVATSEQIGTLAAAENIEFAYVPLADLNPQESHVRATSKFLESLPGPIYAYCKTGGRAAALWALANVANLASDELISRCAAAGYDLSGLRPKLEARRTFLEDDD